MKKDEGSWIVAVIAVLVGFSLLMALLRWLAAHWWVVVLVLLAGAAAAVVVTRERIERERVARERQRALRLALTGPGGIDQLDGDQFEYAVRDLLIRDGCNARKVGAGGDQSVDVLAEDPMGRRWALQCKHKQDPIGGKAVSVGVLYSLAGTYQRIHRAQVPVVVTNGRFSRDSVKWGAEQGVLLVDREVLGRWAASGRPLWEVLPRVPAPRNGTRS